MTTVSFPGLGISLEINRVAFSIGGFEIYWYGIIIGLGLALAMLYTFSKCKTFGIDGDRFLDVVMIGTVAGVIGARLYYVVFAPSGEFTSIMDIIDLRKGGLAFYGAIIFAFASALIAAPLRKVNLRAAFDLASLGFLIGQGMGRWGNFLNQEAFGTNTDLPWGMTSSTVVSYLTKAAPELAERGIIVVPTAPVHPTFLYESLWCFLGFLVLNAYIKHRKFDGEIFLMYLAWNGLGRAFIEGLRTDSLYFGSVRISQVLALAGAFAASVLIIVIWNKIKRSGDPNYLKPYGTTDEAREELESIEKARNDAAKAKKRGGKASEAAKENEEETASGDDAAETDSCDAAAEASDEDKKDADLQK